MNEDPWKDLSLPSIADTINARRVDADVPWGVFWARNVEGSCLFIIQHSTGTILPSRLPKFREIEVMDAEWVDGKSRILVYRLKEAAYRDLFCRLCYDIVRCTSPANTEQEMMRLAITRTWRWHHLLRSGGDQRLSPEEQKGLIGELLFIDRHLLPNINCADVIPAWQGPLGAPKDFKIGRTCVEVKSRRGASKPYVIISSENQLDDRDLDFLYLYVLDLDRSPSSVKNGFCLTDVVSRVCDVISSIDHGVLDAFEELLSASGFRWSDDYSDYVWVVGASRVYQLATDFPRITANQIATGVRDVRYSISLQECNHFLCDIRRLESAIGGKSNGL